MALKMRAVTNNGITDVEIRVVRVVLENEGGQRARHEKVMGLERTVR